MTANQFELFKSNSLESFSNRSRRSAPGDGISLASATESKATGIRQAVCLLADCFQNADVDSVFRSIFAPRWQVSMPWSAREESTANRAAWNLVSIWCVAQASGDLPFHSGLADAEAWFCRFTTAPTALSSQVPPEVLWRTHKILLSVSLDDDFWDLFPYILEQHGPGSRASVMRDASTAVARAAKRREGVFYTPSDVADYMVGHAMENYKGTAAFAKCLDPACGTGVFLLSLCRNAAQRAGLNEDFDRFTYITTCLFGCDISVQALDAGAFVLLRECLSDVRKRKVSPWSAWHAIRLNLAEIDSLTIGAVEPPSPDERSNDADQRLAIKQRLMTTPSEWLASLESPLEDIVAPNGARLGLFGRNSVSLSSLFAEVGHGFDLLVGNPPYALLGRRSDYHLLRLDYRSLLRGKGGVRENCFPLFIEMMWRLTTPGNSTSALVTPLSIAFHGGTQYEDCRHAMYWRGGQWQFAFFDREPHALFGEEVKTRNAILFRFENVSTPKRGEPAEIETGPLRKWTSRTRRELFESINFTPLGRANITSGIPKLNGPHQADAFAKLRKRQERLSGWCNRIFMCNPAEAYQQISTPSVFVAGTAYNFLNVYRGITLKEDANEYLSENSIHCLELGSEKDAQAVFALLSSRLLFWLWHILGDGFHVTASLFNEVPFNHDSFRGESLDLLAGLGASLWEELQAHRIVSVNRGKQTIAFRPLACNRERDMIDAILVEAGNLPPEFTTELREFVERTVVVDRYDVRRHHLHTYFAQKTSS